MADASQTGIPVSCVFFLFIGFASFSTCSPQEDVSVAYHIANRNVQLDSHYTIGDIVEHARFRRAVEADAQSSNVTGSSNTVESITPPPPTPTESGPPHGMNMTGSSGNTGVDESTAVPTTPRPDDENTTPRTTTVDPFAEADIIHDPAEYYNVYSMINNFDSHWMELESSVHHETLSRSHRVAAVIPLKFKFPFYGHPIGNITIATGGFIYMSPFLHQWLTATQYVAPLMANFDPSLNTNSSIYYQSQDDHFIIEWKDVLLQDQNTTGMFHFQAILNQTGEIKFVYKKVPIPVNGISTSRHPVKIGLSDAYYVDTYLPRFHIKRRTIYEYHKVSVKMNVVRSGSVVILKPLPTCNTLTNCDSCIRHVNVNFTCQWCNTIGRCSDRLDWYRQHWDRNGCRITRTNESEACASLPEPPKPIVNPIDHTYPPPNRVKCAGGKCGEGSNTPVAVIVVVIVLVASLCAGIGGWVYYAYTHPTSKSGMWLMEHRPSQIKAKIKFWKDSSDSSDSGTKYKVESEA